MKLRHGDTRLALDVTDRELKQFPSEKTEWHWRFRVLKADILHWQGLDREALSLLQAEPPPSLATSVVAVQRKLVQGVASAFTQHLPDAERYLSEADSLARSYHPDLLGEVALRKGTICYFEDETILAENAYQQALRIAREQKDQFLEASALTGLGLVATKLGHYDESIDWNEAALKLSRSIGARGSLADTLGNTGWDYVELGDLENAQTFYKQAEEASVQSAMFGDQAYWLTSLAYVHYAEHNYEAGEAILKQALSLARAHDDKSTLAQCLTQLAEIALESGRIDQAEEYTEEAAHLKRAGLEDRLVLDTVLLRGRIAQRKGHYSEADAFFQEVIREPKAGKSQRWQAQARVAQVYADEKLGAKAEKEFRRSLETIESTRSSIQTEEYRLSFLSTAISFYNDYIEFLISQQRPADALQVAELSRAKTLAEGLALAGEKTAFSPRDVSTQQTAQRLKSTLLFYWIGRTNSYLWVITPVKTAYFKLPRASDIEPLVKSYRKAVLEMHDAQDTGSSAGKQLFAMLVEPAKKLLPPGSRVIVLPAESLYGLNFETLIVNDSQPHFWIEDVTLTTASSLILLASSATQPPAQKKSLFLVGNIEPPDPAFPPVPQAREEMKQIEKYFLKSQTTVLEGKQATPAAYLNSNPERFSYLHFVTHGTASHTRPLESAVILSKEGDSYKLYARDIVRHRLNASLVTISACYGSGTRSYSGEGLVGLSWAFLRAGAHNVIGALWEVSEASTPQLMDVFYGEVLQGKDTATALRNAKLSLLHSADKSSVFRKPFYWAPFQLYAGS
jgi:CHAT domain-containing protein